MTPDSVYAALTGVKTAVEIAKLLKDSSTTLEQAEIKLKMAELISALADVKIEIADVQSQLLEKDERLKAIQKELEIKSNLAYEKPYYWLMKEEDKDGPYCQLCYDKNKQLIRLQGGGRNAWFCHSCKSNFYDGNYQPPKIHTSTIGFS
jgi:hypothetical protein